MSNNKTWTTEEITNITKILNDVYDSDQDVRVKWDKLIMKYGNNSLNVREYLKKVKRTDNYNLKVVKDIVNKYGWLSSDLIGEKANKALWLVIQHASLEIKLKYYDIIKNSVQKGDINLLDFALFEDRILVEQGKEQIYGTQFKYIEEKNEYILEPLFNPSEVDTRRKKVGLGPISEDLKTFNVSWEYDEIDKK